MLNFNKDRQHIEESIEWHKQIIEKYKALYKAIEMHVNAESLTENKTTKDVIELSRLEVEMLELYKANDIKQKALETWMSNLNNYQAMLERNAIEVNANWNIVMEEAKALASKSGSLQLLLQQWEETKDNAEIKKQFTQQEILNQVYFALKHEVDVARKKK